MNKQVEEIRAEIEKLKSQLLRGACSSQIAIETRCKEEAYNEVLTLLNTMLDDALSKETKESLNERLDKKDFRERYKRIAKSESFKKAHEGISIGDIVPIEGEEPVSENLEEAGKQYLERSNPDRVHQITNAFKAGAKWQFERVNEALLSEVLPCFMHGGEADEVVAKLDEVLNKKK
jgi:hypothetical protein